MFVVVMDNFFPQMSRDTPKQIQEVKRTPNRVNTKISMPGRILVKLQKTKDDKIWKEARGKQSPCLDFVRNHGSQVRVE